MLAFVCAMPMELRPLTRRLGLRGRAPDGLRGRAGDLDGRPVVAIATGMGTELARRRTTELLAAGTVERVLVFGITGAVEDDTPLGTLMRPERVVDASTGRTHRPEQIGAGTAHGAMWTTDVITPASELADLRAQGVVCLDMETAAVADVCENHGVPWSVHRAISDRATDGSVDDEVFRLSRQDGTPDLRAVLCYVGRHPGRVPDLARMARGARLATERSADAAIAAARQTR